MSFPSAPCLEGEIFVVLRARGERAELSVRDSGTGIPQEELPRIFERFHRVKGSKGRSYEGSGIGLALVQELVRLHGGDVRVESAVGEGTTFTVSLPLGHAHLPQERLAAASSLASTATGTEAYVQEARGWLGQVTEPGACPEGAPIPPERLGRIFQPLQRASGEVDKAGRSIGLGLYIVKQVVDAHGGTVSVESTAEAGTTFTVRLPRHASTATQVARAGASSLPAEK